MDIKDDYVSFETAKLLLKREDFSCYSTVGYNKKKELVDIDISQESFFGGASKEYSNKTLPKYEQKWHQQNCPFCIAPTQNLVVKWLRIIHDLQLQLFPVNNKVQEKVAWEWIIFFLKEPLENTDGFKNKMSLTGDNPYYFTPEEATEAAIQYTLKRLL